ncbi:hypothetical protein ACQ4PT_004397 [Festuca glaucescens]
MASEESGAELSGNTQFSESPEVSLGEEEAVEQETDGLEEDLAEMEEEAGNPDQDAGPNLAAYTRGAWKGSDVSQSEIDWLYRSRRIPEEDFPRIAAEELGSFAPKRLYADDEDPDPYTVGNVHKMGPTHSRRPADQDRQVLEHATPLAAEVGDPPASRVRKASAPEAGSSGAPASKRQKVTSSGPPRKKKRNAIPTSSGPALELTGSAPRMRPEASRDIGKTQHPPPHESPAHSGAGKAHSSPRGGTPSSGSAAPKKKHHRAEEDSSSLPEVEDTGASNTGAGSEQTGQPEPSAPPVLEQTSQIVTASPAKGAAAPPSTSSSKPPPAPFGQKLSRKSTNITAEQLSGAVEAAVAQPAGSRELTLHVGRTAIAVGEKVSAQLGRIVELNRGEANLGVLQRYVDKWNTSDMTEATLGVGKDRQAVIDPRGLRNTVQHLARLKHAMREFDNAWHDANHNVLVSFFPALELFSSYRTISQLENLVISS